LSAKAFDALQGYKQEIAATLYGGQEQGPEEDTDHEEDEEEVTYAEGVEHDGEQLDELSKKTLSSYIKNAVGRSQDDHREAGYFSAGLSDRDGDNRTQKISRAVDKLAAKKTNK